MMRIEIDYRGCRHVIDYQDSIRLSTRLDFAENSVNLYGITSASEEPLHYDTRIASVKRGGASNASRISLVPHCHGTHTECIGHILPERHHMADLDIPLFIPATLIRVSLQRFSEMKDCYNSYADDIDWIITADAIEHALAPLGSDYLQALVIATDNHDWLPDGIGAPYFSYQAISRLVELGVQHLLVDIPSIDRLNDGGLMENHRCFWGIQDPHHPIEGRKSASVTELIKVPSNISAGHYILSIQLPDLSGDALPSRPLLFPFSL
ncbi:cyclase family protein [Enterobacteriaceae bacterium BIT-l23]|uniref:cyclase family protein n=1 Tax=Jejubacter sp. L23 TaxID=3092086 RepID=UPI0015854949|nr:cyclase family protein [Enterobacteriaceae bacterium BIT-l23]